MAVQGDISVPVPLPTEIHARHCQFGAASGRVAPSVRLSSGSGEFAAVFDR
jgi:hypothetical protein